MVPTALTLLWRQRPSEYKEHNGKIQASTNFPLTYISNYCNIHVTLFSCNFGQVQLPHWMLENEVLYKKSSGVSREDHREY